MDDLGLRRRLRVTAREGKEQREEINLATVAANGMEETGEPDPASISNNRASKSTWAWSNLWEFASAPRKCTLKKVL
jgi:hypothetical protein